MQDTTQLNIVDSYSHTVYDYTWIICVGSRFACINGICLAT